MSDSVRTEGGFGMLPLMGPPVREPLPDAPAAGPDIKPAIADAALTVAPGKTAAIGLDQGAGLPAPTDLGTITPGVPTSTPTPPGKLRVKKRRKRKKGRRPPIDGPRMDALESAFGPWKGIGKNKNPRESTGPKGNKLLNEAYEKLQAGDCDEAKQLYEKAKKTASPIMFDLNHDGKLGTTGASTAKDRLDPSLATDGTKKGESQSTTNGQTGKTVAFDLDGDGKKDQVEWADGKGDGFLIDDSDGGASRAMIKGEDVDGKRLFGDEGGKYANGFEKLEKFDANGDGVLDGAELEGLKMWVDNGDAKLGGGELRTLGELGITKISISMQVEKNDRGEDLMRSTYTQDGKEQVSEDVWFAKQ